MRWSEKCYCLHKHRVHLDCHTHFYLSWSIKKIRCAGQTDIGGGRENQDMWFSWVDPAETGTHVIGVLDGHGREVS